MTTKVEVTCPDNSHWNLQVLVEDRRYDHDAKKYTDEWEVTQTFELKPTERVSLHLHDSRRLRVEETERK